MSNVTKTAGMTDADCLRVYRDLMGCVPGDDDAVADAALMRVVSAQPFDVALLAMKRRGMVDEVDDGCAREWYDDARTIASRLGYPVAGDPTCVTVTVDDPHGLVKSVDVVAECPAAVVLHVELTGRDIEPNCAGRGDGGDGIGFYRIVGYADVVRAQLRVANLPLDAGEFGPVWAYTAGGFTTVTVTITPARHGRTVYERKAADDE